MVEKLEAKMAEIGDTPEHKVGVGGEEDGGAGGGIAVRARMM